MNPNEDFLGAYREVTGRLKKRFLRKPNASQASEELSGLGRRLNEQGAHPYAAFFSQAAARCEKEAGNEQREAEALTEAARRFMTSVRDAKRLRTLHFQEDLVSAVQCFKDAVGLYMAQGQQTLAASLYLELADVLSCELERSSEAVPFYKETVELLRQNTTELLHVLGKLATCHVNSNDLESALTCFMEMMTIIRDCSKTPDASSEEVVVELFGPHADMMRRCEISVILLVLTLKPLDYNVSSKSKYARVFEKYRNWDPLSLQMPVNYISEDMFMLLNAVILAGEAKDVEGLRELQKDLWPILSAEQNHLMQVLLESSYT